MWCCSEGDDSSSIHPPEPLPLSHKPSGLHLTLPDFQDPETGVYTVHRLLGSVLVFISPCLVEHKSYFARETRICIFTKYDLLFCKLGVFVHVYWLRMRTVPGPDWVCMRIHISYHHSVLLYVCWVSTFPGSGSVCMCTDWVSVLPGSGSVCMCTDWVSVLHGSGLLCMLVYNVVCVCVCADCQLSLGQVLRVVRPSLHLVWGRPLQRCQPSAPPTDRVPPTSGPLWSASGCKQVQEGGGLHYYLVYYTRMYTGVG